MESSWGLQIGAAYSIDRQLYRSVFYELGSDKSSEIGIGFINGIRNTLEDSVRSTVYTSHLADGRNVCGIYNATHGLMADLMECGGAQQGVHVPPVQLLKNQWQQFFEKHPNGRFLQICHSGGTIHVKNTLLDLPQALRNRITVVAIAPAAIVPKELCYDSFNYVSRRDFVVYTDFRHTRHHLDELTVLQPHPDAPFFDHDFMSPTFTKRLSSALSQFISTGEIHDP
jgi:hypothetical protein